MKKIIKNIIIYIIGIIGEIYIFIYLPYYDMRIQGDGFYVLFPIMITPLIGLVIGLFIKSNIKYIFVGVTLIFSVLFVYTYCKEIDDILLIYVLAYMFNTAVGIGIGHGVRVLVFAVSKKIRCFKANK